jgi:hypothetical protein
MLGFERFGLGLFLFFMFAQGRRVLGAFVCSVGGEFRAVGRASGLDFFGVFFGKRRDFRSGNLLRLVCFFFLWFVGGFFLEFGAADDGVGFGFFLRFFVFGFDETGSEGRDLIFIQLDVIPCWCGIGSRSFDRGRFFGRTCGSSLRLRACVGQEPAWQTSGESAWYAGATWTCSRDVGWRAGSRLFRFLPLFLSLMFDERRWRRRGLRLAAIFCERFAREDDGLLGCFAGSRASAAGDFWATIVVAP